MDQNLNLRMMLHKRKITQTALSKKTKIPRQYISSALTGRVNLSPVEKKKVAHVLNCEIKEIF